MQNLMLLQILVYLNFHNNHVRQVGYNTFILLIRNQLKGYIHDLLQTTWFMKGEPGVNKGFPIPG